MEHYQNGIKMFLVPWLTFAKKFIKICPQVSSYFAIQKITSFAEVKALPVWLLILILFWSMSNFLHPMIARNVDG